jgi:hypothetical protein
VTGSVTNAWTGAGNDYRGIDRLPTGPAPDVAVVLLSTATDEMREALAVQGYEGRIEVLDPGSEPGVEAGLLIFLGPDQVPGPGWVGRHAGWHRRASNLVVVGGGAGSDRSDRAIRRSRLLLSGDQAFTALPSSNVSMRTDLWERAGRPARLDVVAGWRLWNEGAFFVPDPGAELPGPSAPIDPGPTHFLQDQIPHRGLRPTPSSLHSVPKVSWVVTVQDGHGADLAWETVSTSTFSDHEVAFQGPSDALAALEPVAAVNPRVGMFPGGAEAFAAAVTWSRGELIAILDGRAGVARDALARAVGRFEANPGAGVVLSGYRIDGDRYLRLDDLAALDRALGVHGLPLFALVARRELMKDPLLLGDPGKAWSSVLDRVTPALVISPLVEMSGPAPISARPPGPKEVRSAGLREIARAAVKERRSGRTSSERAAEPAPPDDEPRISVAYVGFTGHDNLGDEAVMIAIKRLMPWADIEAEPVDPRLLMVGGGTLINGRRYYLNRLLRQESATVERALFGTGVRNPGYWGVTEPMEDWFSFIDSALVAALRGPDSVKNLRELGYHRDLPVIGDPALSLRPPPGTRAVEGRVVVCPVYTSGNLHGGSDEAVFEALARIIGKLSAEGREVVLISAFPQDDRWIIDLMRRSGIHDIPYLAGYADIDETMALLASSDLVIGERLHAVIMAAAAGTPFVGLEYRPKVRDFARSVSQEAAVIRTDEMERLDEVCARILASADLVAAETSEHVEEYRRRQEAAAAELLHRLEGS